MPLYPLAVVQVESEFCADPDAEKGHWRRPGSTRKLGLSGRPGIQPSKQGSQARNSTWLRTALCTRGAPLGVLRFGTAALSAGTHRPSNSALVFRRNPGSVAMLVTSNDTQHPCRQMFTDSDRLDPQIFERADDAHRDLAAVGDQDAPNRAHVGTPLAAHVERPFERGDAGHAGMPACLPNRKGLQAFSWTGPCLVRPGAAARGEPVDAGCLMDARASTLVRIRPGRRRAPALRPEHLRPRRRSSSSAS